MLASSRNTLPDTLRKNISSEHPVPSQVDTQSAITMEFLHRARCGVEALAADSFSLITYGIGTSSLLSASSKTVRLDVVPLNTT